VRDPGLAGIAGGGLQWLIIASKKRKSLTAYGEQQPGDEKEGLGIADLLKETEDCTEKGYAIGASKDIKKTCIYCGGQKKRI